MRFFLTFILLLTSLLLNAQSEADNWFFGTETGLKFNGTSTPSAQYGALRTLEGCASISDTNGNLLFYSDGSTVWDRNHQVMPNGTGLLGDESSTQSAIIVPNPVLSNIYYLFTVGSTQVPSGYHYYTIDMSLNGGFGSVVGPAVDLSGEDNSFDWSEKITAVNGETCNTYWVISLVRNKYYAHKVDENGVDLTPTISPVSFLASSQSRGYLKVSPNGEKLASAHQGMNGTENGLYLYSFDNSTGEVINDGITLFNSTIQTYGVEFSPKTTKLYASTILDETYRLFQFDLTASNIASSSVLIHEEQQAFRGALQLGPDLKIYVTIPETYLIGTNYIDVIHNPELYGAACDFDQDYVFFGADNYVMQGLPPFIQSFFYEDEINIVNPFEPVTSNSSELELCLGSSYTLEGEDIVGAVYNWTFSDGLSTIDLPTPSPPHKLTINGQGNDTEGLYTLHIDTNDECNTLLIGEANVTFTDSPVVNPFVSISSCDLFDDNPNDGLTTFNLQVSLSAITNGNPTNFEVYFYLNDIDAENDIYNQNALSEYYKNTSPNQLLTAKVYKLNSNCYGLGQLQLNVSPAISLNAIDLSKCNTNDDNIQQFDLNEQLNNIMNINTLPGSIDITFYQNIEDAVDNTNPISGVFESSDNLLYFYAELNGLCYGSGSFNIAVNPLPPIDIEEETIDVCQTDFPVILESSIPSDLLLNYDFLWSSGETSNSIITYFPQSYSVTITDRLTLCKSIKTYILNETHSPIISSVETNINTGNVTILTTENLDNQYSLDNPNGPFQNENIFLNVSPGIHTVYVQNQNNCRLTEREIYVLGFPKFFTPNEDSFNDFWKIKGIKSNTYTISDIYIFNRFGKLLKVLSPESEWDGTFNGNKLPSSSYWFFVDITDKNNIVKTYKGYFSLVL